MLHGNPVIGFIPTAQPERAKAFYRDTLGLRLVEDTPFALVFDASGTMLRVTRVQEVVAAPYTVFGWRVDDIDAKVRDLAARGLTFERYPGLEQDAAGIWTSPDSARIAWFKDPDGNTLSLAQFPNER